MTTKHSFTWRVISALLLAAGTASAYAASATFHMQQYVPGMQSVAPSAKFAWVTTPNVSQTFASATVGQAAPDISLSIQNTGNLAGSLMTPTMGGANAADFTVGSNTCANVAPGATCALTFHFVPSAVGARSASTSVLGTNLTFSGTGLAPTDSNYANVVMLLPFDATVSDLKGTSMSNQSVSISSAASVFGGASAYFSGSSSYLTFPYSGNFNFSNMSSFTVELWFNPSAIGGYQYLMEKGTWGSNHDFSILLTDASTIRVMTAGTTAQLAATVPTMTSGTWHHVAVVRNNGTNTIYLDGVAYASNTMGFSNADGNPIIIGGASWNNPTVQEFKGYIDELRITRNVARYTGNFTVPTAPFPVQ